VKLDSHVHTRHSGHTSVSPLSLVMRESYDTPEGVYYLARLRGMELVTITDHDQVDGALSLAHLAGLVCPGVDADSWADHIGSLLASTNLRQSMGRAARDYAVSRRWDAALTPLYQSYREVGDRRTSLLSWRSRPFI
jgi:hypothetical protein